MGSRIERTSESARARPGASLNAVLVFFILFLSLTLVSSFEPPFDLFFLRSSSAHSREPERGAAPERENTRTDTKLSLPSDLIIERGQTRVFEAGTTVSMGIGVNITVYGSFHVLGQRRRPVIFRAEIPGGNWGSIIVEEGGFAHIKDAVFRGAERSIICNNSSPVLENVSIEGGTTGMIFLGRCAPLVRNATVLNVKNGIGWRGPEDTALESVPGGDKWSVSFGEEGERTEREIDVLTGDNLEDILGVDTGSAPAFLSANSTGPPGTVPRGDTGYPERITVERSLKLTEESTERLRNGSLLHLSLTYGGSMAVEGKAVEEKILVEVNGIEQAVGTRAYLASPDPGSSPILDPEYLSRYRGRLENEEGAGPGLAPVANVMPNEFRIALDRGLKQGVNTVRIYLEKEAFFPYVPSVYMKLIPEVGGIFHNVSVSNVEGWGFFVQSASPSLSEARVRKAGRLMVIKGPSQPLLWNSRFEGGASSEGLRADDGASFVRAIGTDFVDLKNIPFYVVGGGVALFNCSFRDIRSDDPALAIEGNPELLPEIDLLHELRPSVIGNTFFGNISNWAIRADDGDINVIGSIFENTDLGLYIGEGCEGLIKGNILEEIRGTGVLVYRALDGKLLISDNTLKNVRGHGILVKETRLSMVNNVVIGEGEGMVKGEITEVYLASRSWGIFLEDSTVRLEDERLENDPFSVFVTGDSSVNAKGLTVVAETGIGLAVLTDRTVRLRDCVVAIGDGYEMVSGEDADVRTENTTINRSVGVQGPEGPAGKGDGVFAVLVTITAAVLLALVAVRIRNGRDGD